MDQKDIMSIFRTVNKLGNDKHNFGSVVSLNSYWPNSFKLTSNEKVVYEWIGMNDDIEFSEVASQVARDILRFGVNGIIDKKDSGSVITKK